MLPPRINERMVSLITFFSFGYRQAHLVAVLCSVFFIVERERLGRGILRISCFLFSRNPGMVSLLVRICQHAFTTICTVLLEHARPLSTCTKNLCCK